MCAPCAPIEKSNWKRTSSDSHAFRKPSTTILAADLTELARPVCEEQRRSFVDQRGIVCAFRPVITGTGKPATSELVVAADVHAKRRRIGFGLLAAAPEQFRAPEEPPVNGARERPVAQRRVDGNNPRRKVGTEIIPTPRNGGSNIEVGRFRHVVISAQPPDITQVAARMRFEDAGRAAIDLTRGLEKHPWVRDETRDGQTSVCESLFPAEQVLADQRPIRPWQCVGMERVDFAHLLFQLPYLGQQATRERRERNEAFFNLDAFGREGDEEVRPGVRIDNRLERRFRLVHLEGRRGVDLVATSCTQEIADDRDVRVEDLGQRGRAAVDGQRSLWSAGASRTCRNRRFSRGSRRRGRCWFCRRRRRNGRRRLRQRGYRFNRCRSASFDLSKTSLERRQSRAVRIADRLELATQPVELFADLRRVA